MPYAFPNTAEDSWMPNRNPVAAPTPTTPAAGTLGGAGTQAGSGAFGAVPTVPSLQSTQGQAIGGNLANLGSLSGLTGQLNQLTATQAALPYQLNLPNYSSMLSANTGNILSNLQGQIPGDVSAQLQQLGAERGIATGNPGSPNSNAALLRALGQTSLGLQTQGAQQFNQAIASTPTGAQFNPAQFLVSPAEQQQAQYAANTLAAAPNPNLAAATSLGSALSGLNRGAASVGAAPGVNPGFANQVASSAPVSYAPSSVSQPGVPASTPYGQPDAAAPWQTGVGTDQPGYQPYTGSYGPYDYEQLFGGGDDWQSGMPYEGSTDFGLGDLFGGG